jgi:hypothetical protein
MMVTWGYHDATHAVLANSKPVPEAIQGQIADPPIVMELTFQHVSLTLEDDGA